MRGEGGREGVAGGRGGGRGGGGGGRGGGGGEGGGRGGGGGGERRERGGGEGGGGGRGGGGGGRGVVGGGKFRVLAVAVVATALLGGRVGPGRQPRAAACGWAASRAASRARPGADHVQRRNPAVARRLEIAGHGSRSGRIRPASLQHQRAVRDHDRSGQVQRRRQRDRDSRRPPAQLRRCLLHDRRDRRNPALGRTLGFAAWARYVADWDLGHHLIPRTAPVFATGMSRSARPTTPKSSS